MAFGTNTIHTFLIRPVPIINHMVAPAAGNAYESGTGKTAPAADLMVVIGLELDGVDSELRRSVVRY